MTAEVAIMNKLAVALAADSAVTMELRGRRKIYDSINKLFALSKFRPVGIMVYGNAEFMDVPWETIIKLYRARLGIGAFQKLEDYVVDFIRFIESENSLFPNIKQEEYFRGAVSGYYAYNIREEIDTRVKNFLKDNTEIDDEQIKKIVETTIGKHLQELEKNKDLEAVSQDYIEHLIGGHEKIISEVIKEVFENLPISGESLNNLKKIPGLLFSKEIFLISVSGVVIAGFGEAEFFPSLIRIQAEGIVDNKLKYGNKRESKIDLDNSARISAFAQREMVVTFMEGIDPGVRNFIDSALEDIFIDKYPGMVVEDLQFKDSNEKENVVNKLKKVGKGIVDEFKRQTREYTKKYYSSPVTEAVTALPKDELATMAETFVNLTSFKRKISTDTEETVGGPIDVAVISKGDGFVWIKRKHYFRADLNQQFFANYFRDSLAKGEEETL